ncbi:hypothetical protein ACWDWS_02465 [Streptomyces sp. NPDC003328]
MASVEILSDDEKSALALMHRQNGVVLQRQGVALKTAESLAQRGLAYPVERLGGRKWYTELTNAGKPVAEEHRLFTGPETVDTKTATSRVARELFKGHPDYGLQSVYERIDLTTYSHFVESAKSWCRDRSELREAVIESADYRELYPYLCEQEDRQPVWDDRPPGKPVRHTRTGAIVGYLTEGKFIPIEESESG